LGRNGPAQGSINIVLVPSNFNGDMDLFRAKSDELYAEFQRHTPIAADGGLVNVWRVMQEATGYGPAQPSSYCGFYGMGTRMDCERCLYCDTTKAKTLAAYCDFGFASTVIVLHNSDIYGGVGYTEEGVGTVSTVQLAGLIAVHELGHSLFRLGDEYTYGFRGSGLGLRGFGFGVARRGGSNLAPLRYSESTQVWPNCAATSMCVPWAPMLGQNGVSCRPGCAASRYWISEFSIMEALGTDRFYEVLALVFSTRFVVLGGFVDCGRVLRRATGGCSAAANECRAAHTLTLSHPHLQSPSQEVNERLTCCAFSRLVQRFPAYCVPRYGTASALQQVCDTAFGKIPGAAPGATSQWVQQPTRVTLRLEAGEWRETARRALPAGPFLPQDLRGSAPSGAAGTLTVRLAVDCACGKAGAAVASFVAQQSIDVPPVAIGAQSAGAALGHDALRAVDAITLVLACDVPVTVALA